MSGYLIQQEIRYCVRKYERNGHAGGGSLSYLSLYPIPAMIADVVGQRLLFILQNALERGRVSHAYMFRALEEREDHFGDLCQRSELPKVRRSNPATHAPIASGSTMGLPWTLLR